MNASDLILESLRRIHEKMDDMSERIVRVEVNVDRNTKDLEEHIEGVKQTRILISTHEERDRKAFEYFNNRISVLEEPKKVRKFLTNGLIGLGSISMSLFFIYRLLIYLRDYPLF
jgi:hypothetical protein